MKRLKAIFLILAASFGSCCGPDSLKAGENMTADTICLIEDGSPLANIIIPAGNNRSAEAFANLLSEYIRLSTNVKMPVREEPDTISPVNIYLGDTLYAKQFNSGIEKLDADGFIISFPDKDNMIIAGGSEWGIEFAVYEFLERYLGVRWLFPGELGEHIPKHRTLSIPTKEVEQEPAFLSRYLTGVGMYGGDIPLSSRKTAVREWLYRNRMRNRMEFHHNLHNLFRPSQYVKTHPEFYPIREGKRFLPVSDSNDARWNPCFSAEGIVDEAAKNIKRHFAGKPGVTSYSLGINDYRFCECRACLSRISGNTNFAGYVDYSNPYYEWANKVAEQVLEEYPDKYFGLLAYDEVAAPPSGTKLNPRVIPYMTYDRMKWADKEIEEEGHELTKAWAKAASTLGWYDYIWGLPYVIPRVYFHEMADYLRFGYENGTRHYYAQCWLGATLEPDGWAEGPKLYLTLKLLWDPYLDVDKTLNEWYECAVGKDAAPYLASYFELLEEFWTKRILKSEWFTNRRKTQYLKFHDTSYLDVFTSKDVTECERLLKLTVAKAKTRTQQLRAEFFLSTFEKWKFHPASSE